MRELVTTGNLEDHLDLLKDCDWIVEAVLEDPGIKQALYATLEGVRKPGSVVSSNTSTIPLADLVKDMPDTFRHDFLITHFFNPPRYMRLLELVAGPETRPEAVAEIGQFCDVALGKGVVRCKDRPGFIANRVGGMWVQAAINAALDLGLSVEEADAIMGRPFGMPKTGIFALLDLVGIDLMPHVGASMKRTLPAGDPYAKKIRFPDLFQKMIDDGYTGRKGKGGFYRLNRAGGGKVKEAIDLKTGEYRVAAEPRLDSLVAAATARDPSALLRHPDRGGQFARRVLGQTLAYAALLVPEIADDIVAVDEAMRLGYAWKLGPFELIDQIGVDLFIAGLGLVGISGAAAVAQGGGQILLSHRRRPPRLSHRRRRLRARRARARRPAPCRHQAPQQAAGQERLGQPVGHRRWRRLPRIPQQDECARSGQPGDAGDRAPDGRRQDEGARRL